MSDGQCGAAPMMNSGARQPQVMAEVDALHMAIGDQNNLIASLQERLASVVMAVPKDGAIKDTPQPIRVPLAGTIHSGVEQLHSHNAMLREILAGLEL